MEDPLSASARDDAVTTDPAPGAVRARRRGSPLAALEIAIVLVAAMAFASAYLDLDPNVIPSGREYPTAVQPYYVWQRLRTCGPCAFWNGSVRGGYPAFAETHAGVLHPLPAAMVLFFGVATGMKLVLVGAFALAGLAQWWLGRVLGLSPIARTWAALVAVMAGNLAGRMEGGWINVVLATAASALVFPPLVALMRTASRRSAVLLGAALAMALLAGQAYPQMGVAAVLPLALVPLEPGISGRVVARRIGLALVIAVLLAAPFLVPFGAMLPEFVKDQDPAFRTAQPFRYIPLNFVIDDEAFYRSDALGKHAFPSLYATFVGWLPVVLALVAVAAAFGSRDRVKRRTVVFLLAAVAIPLWFAGAQPLRALLVLSPLGWLDGMLGGIRNPALIGGVVTTPLLGLAAIGVDRVLAARWPLATWEQATDDGLRRVLAVSTRWLMVLPLALALLHVGRFNARWISTTTLPPAMGAELDALVTPELAWVMPPFGEHLYVLAAVDRGMKVVSDLKPWHWRDRNDPAPLMLASRSEETDPSLRPVDQIDGVRIYRGPPDRAYATLLSGDDRVVCDAAGIGGDVTVRCPASGGGTLTVKEHMARGWQAKVSGQRVALAPGAWLALALPPGAHVVELRYRPWDVPVGMLLCLVGMATAAVVWRRDRYDSRSKSSR